MPYFFDPLEDQQNQNQQQQQTEGAPHISGASPTSDSGGNFSQGSGPQKPLNTGSGFQNIDKYLQTNNSQGFGQQVTGKVEGQIQNAQQGMQQASDRFKGQVQGANQIPTQNDVNSAIANPQGANKQQFQSWENQSYQGPKSVAESPDIQNQYWGGVEKANQQAKLLGTEPGRFTLLDSYFKRPNYNFGEKSLDNLLLQKAGAGGQSKAIQDQAASLYGQGNAQLKDLSNSAAQRAQEVDQSRQGVRQAIGIDDQGNVLTGDRAGAIGKDQKMITDATAAQNQIRQQDQQDIMAALNSGTLSQHELQQLGIAAPSPLYPSDPNSPLNNAGNLYNLNLTDYLSKNPDLTVDQVMTPDQRARMQALSDLAGVNNSFSGNASDPTQSFSFDNTRFQAAQTAAASQAKNLQDQLNQLGDKQPTMPLGQDIHTNADGSLVNVGNDSGRAAAVNAYNQWLNSRNSLIQQLAAFQPTRQLNITPDPSVLLPPRQVGVR